VCLVVPHKESGIHVPSALQAACVPFCTIRATKQVGVAQRLVFSPTILSVSPVANGENGSPASSRAVTKMCFNHSRTRLHRHPAPPNGDVFEFAAYATTVPTTSLSRFTSYSLGPRCRRPPAVAARTPPAHNAIATVATIEKLPACSCLPLPPGNLFPTQQTLPHFFPIYEPNPPAKVAPPRKFSDSSQQRLLIDTNPSSGHNYMYVNPVEVRQAQFCSVRRRATRMAPKYIFCNRRCVFLLSVRGRSGIFNRFVSSKVRGFKITIQKMLTRT